VAAEGVTARRARRRLSRDQARKNSRFTGRWTPGSVKKVASCSVTTTGVRTASGIV
jgi:hypothetical protein